MLISDIWAQSQSPLTLWHPTVFSEEKVDVQGHHLAHRQNELVSLVVALALALQVLALVLVRVLKLLVLIIQMQPS